MNERFSYDECEYGIVQLRNVDLEKRDPSTVVAIILGGGAGTRLFPLTKRRAKPAVSFSILILAPILFLIVLFIINTVFL